MAEPAAVLVPKNTTEHERHFKAFLDGTILVLTAYDLFGNASRTDALVWSVEHVGSKTRFGFKESRQGASSRPATSL